MHNRSPMLQSCCPHRPSTSSLPSTSTLPLAKQPTRPRGLWKARGTAAPPLANHHHHKPPPESDSVDNDDDELTYHSDSSSSSSRKRRRLESESPLTSDAEEVLYWDYSRRCKPHPERLDKWTTRSKLMDTSSTGRGVPQATGPPQECDLEDWEDLKELFAKAVEMYETQEASESISLLRGVIHESHRILSAYPDPSTLFTTPTTPPATSSSATDYYSSSTVKKSQGTSTTSSYDDSASKDKEKKCKCVDLPTAFHTLLGTTLFFFGNLISQDPTLVLEGELSTPMTYWLSAIDVFELGDNLPIRTSGRACHNAPQDWRMAVMWGRSLVCIADEMVSRQKDQENGVPVPPLEKTVLPVSPRHAFSHTSSSFIDYTALMPNGGLGSPPTLGSLTRPTDDPDWPPESPFALIKSTRQSRLPGRNSMMMCTPHDLMLLAQDQFARGVFHMPHPHQRGRLGGNTRSGATSSSAAGSKGTSSGSADTPVTFSRAKELFTIASEVLLFAEKLPEPGQRARWSSWSDSVLTQMKMELSSSSDPQPIEVWKGILMKTKGRCCLVSGSARSEEMEEALEKGEMDVLGEERADDARDALQAAIEHFDVAKEIFEERVKRKREDGGSAAQEGYIVVEGDDEDDEIENMEFDDADAPAGLMASKRKAKGRKIKIMPPSAEKAGPVESQVEEDEEELEDLTELLVEALVTLANLTVDAKERETLYERAKAVGGDMFQLDDEDRMDESG